MIDDPFSVLDALGRLYVTVTFPNVDESAQLAAYKLLRSMLAVRDDVSLSCSKPSITWVFRPRAPVEP